MRAAGSRKAEAEATRDAILLAAIDEFSQKGFGGGRLEIIAAQAGIAKRMIYYYFESKEGLYLAVLERAYRDVRQVERALDLDALSPVEAIRVMAEETLLFQEGNPAIVRLICLENIQQGKFIEKLSMVEEANAIVINMLSHILDRGVASGVFRAGIDPVDVHMMISAFCAFRVDHRHTFSKLFRRDLLSEELRDHHKDLLAELILRYLRKD